jgi:YggT family protein
MGHFLLFIIGSVLELLIVALVLNVVLSWLVVFDVINLRNPFMRQLVTFLDAVTRPILKPLQRVIPLIGGFDITPIIAIIILEGVNGYLLPWLFGPVIAILG